jgi:hypothetical protein
MLSDLLPRPRALFRRTAVDREIDEELRLHVGPQIASYKKGELDEAEAPHRARLEFGIVAGAIAASRALDTLLFGISRISRAASIDPFIALRDD